jgi:hypothetical protein
MDLFSTITIILTVLSVVTGIISFALSFGGKKKPIELKEKTVKEVLKGRIVEAKDKVKKLDSIIFWNKILNFILLSTEIGVGISLMSTVVQSLFLPLTTAIMGLAVVLSSIIHQLTHPYKKITNSIRRKNIINTALRGFEHKIYHQRNEIVQTYLDTLNNALCAVENEET